MTEIQRHQVARQLVEKFPILKETTEFGQGYEGWARSIDDKMNNKRRNMGERGSAAVEVNLIFYYNECHHFLTQNA